MKKTVSIIVTAANEPNSIGICLDRLLDTNLNGLNDAQKFIFEIITVIPDELTNKIASETINKYRTFVTKHIKLIDPWQGKPFALNLALKKAKGDYLVLTDGDVYFSKDSLAYLLNKLVKGDKYSAVTGRPVSKDTKSSFWGYIGHLLADAANDKRQVAMIDNRKFFVMSGYIIAMKNLKISLPKDCLSEDAYISYLIHNLKLQIGYEPKACVYVKYPKTFKDWMNQKSRSVGGYMQLWTYGVVKKNTKVRNFWKELEYIFFPIKYAKSLKELIWSSYLYPLRLYLWLRIFWEQKIKRKEVFEPWTRIESTK